MKGTDIVYINTIADAKTIFGNNVDIKGGVNYFLKDSSYDGKCELDGSFIDLPKSDIIRNPKYNNIVKAVQEYDNITIFYKSQDYHKIQTNDKRLQKLKGKNDVVCYVSQKKGLIQYIDKNELVKDATKHKVLVPDGAYGANSGFGNIIVTKPNEVHSKTYISFEFDTGTKANSFASYLKCKLPNLMLSLRKLSQHTNADTCKWIPVVPLDREWTDKEVYEYFDFSEEDVELIKTTKISGYDDSKKDSHKKSIKVNIVLKKDGGSKTSNKKSVKPPKITKKKLKEVIDI